MPTFMSILMPFILKISCVFPSILFLKGLTLNIMSP